MRVDVLCNSISRQNGVGGHHAVSRGHAAPNLSLCIYSGAEFRFHPVIIHIVFVLCK